jgi:leader peptidase (prepilin peptidase)/N-methyltransferase
MLSDLAALYVEQPALFAGSVFILGLMVGSFLNVVIYRLPIILQHEWRAQATELLVDPASPEALDDQDLPGRFSLSFPRSACPVCKAPITALQNIPVISWLVLRGRCAACKVRISARYPVVEICSGLLSAWVAWHFGFGTTALCGLVITWTLIALTGIDIDHQLLPDNITLPLMWGGLLASVVLGGSGGQELPISPQSAIVGAASGYLSLWLVFQLFRLVTGKEGMGYGDFKLFAALGAWMGWKLLPLVIILAAATGAVLGILMIALRGRDRAAPMPFGPYLAAAGWLAMMYGDTLVSGYLRLSGLRR